MMLYVRGRDGAWYRNPLHVFAEGYVSFAPLELVLWVQEDGMFTRPTEIIAREFHGGLATTDVVEAGERAVPGGNPPVKMAAVAFELQLLRRIPVPTMHDGDERRLSRVPKPYATLDPPADPRDAHQLYPGIEE